MASIIMNSNGQMIADNGAGFSCDGTITLIPQYDNELNFGGSNSNNTILFGYTAKGSKARITGAHFGNNDANVQAKVFAAGSSREIKHDIKDFDKSALDLLNDVKIVYYRYNNDETDKQMVGFIAEDTDELFAFKTHNGMDINTCIGVLMKAIQELKKKKDKLEKEIDELLEQKK